MMDVAFSPTPINQIIKEERKENVRQMPGKNKGNSWGGGKICACSESDEMKVLCKDWKGMCCGDNGQCGGGEGTARLYCTVLMAVINI